MRKHFNKIKFHIAGWSFLLLSSCSHVSLPPQEYSRWIQDSRNGLCTSQVSGEFLFKLQYKPCEYIALMNDTKKISKDQLKKDVDELSDMYYYTLSISSKDCNNEMLKTRLSSPDEYTKRLNYFLFQFKKDLYLLDENDSIPCVFSHFERSYALLPYNSFLLAFPKNKNAKAQKKNQQPRQQTLVYRDKILNVGEVHLSLNLPTETKIPLVKL